MDTRSLRCVRCDAPLDVPAERPEFYCSYCGTRLRVIQDAASEALRLYEAEPAALPIPASLQLEEFGGALRISWRWFSTTAYALLLFCIAWDSFLVFWYTRAVVAGGGGVEWIAVVFPVGHVAVGVGMTYYCAALFLNRTRIQVADGLIAVAHGPLPWRGNRTILADDIAQLYVARSRRQGKWSENQMRDSFDVRAVLANERSIDLVRGLDDLEAARAIERRIEAFLGIEDRRVVGEERD